MLLFQLINGKADKTLRVNDLLPLLPIYSNKLWVTLSAQSIVVVAAVLEEVTGTILSANSTVQCTGSKYMLNFLPITPDSFKPGLAFNGFVSIVT